VLVALASEIFVESVQKAAETFGMSPAFVGFIIVSIVGAAAEMAVAFSAARKNSLDMSVSIALGSASQIALFVAPALVLLSYVVGPAPMNLQFWPGAVTMVMIAAVTACFITNSGRSAWFIGALLLFIYAIFAMTLYILPPGSQQAASTSHASAVDQPNNSTPFIAVIGPSRRQRGTGRMSPYPNVVKLTRAKYRRSVPSGIAPTKA
jgi:Ca2+:H+ antiporter